MSGWLAVGEVKGFLGQHGVKPLNSEQLSYIIITVIIIRLI